MTQLIFLNLPAKTRCLDRCWVTGSVPSPEGNLNSPNRSLCIFIVYKYFCLYYQSIESFIFYTEVFLF